MYTFEKRDEGYYVSHENGRGVAHVDTKSVGETNNSNLKVQEKVIKDIPKESWKIHFTGFKLKPGEVKAFLEELLAQN